jgi:hypothetical protein
MENWIFNYNSENFDFGGGGTQEFVEVANFGALPVTGDSGVIYVTLDTNKLYRWSGTTYVEISPMEIPLLSSVLDVGNASGPNDISFDAGQGLYFANSSRLREGTIDASLGGAKGISQICAVGYELKWEAGRLYVMDGNGTGIRQSLYNFTNVPTVTDDVTKGYAIGSLWTLDDNTTYICSDATTGAAVWSIVVPTPSVQSVVSSATVTPVFGNDLVVITAQAAGLTLANPTGTWVQGKDLVIRIKDNGTPRSIAYGGKYRAIGVTSPTTTVANKTTYLGIVYNSTDDTFDIIGVTTQA